MALSDYFLWFEHLRCNLLMSFYWGQQSSETNCELPDGFLAYRDQRIGKIYGIFTTKHTPTEILWAINALEKTMASVYKPRN